MHVGGELIQTFGVINFGADAQGQNFTRRVFISVGQGQETQKAFIAGFQLIHHLFGAKRVMKKCAVMQHYPFGRAPRAGCVNQASDLVGGDQARGLKIVIEIVCGFCCGRVPVYDIKAEILLQIRVFHRNGKLQAIGLKRGRVKVFGQRTR